MATLLEQTYKKGKNASDSSSIYFQTHNLERLCKEDASLVFDDEPALRRSSVNRSVWDPA